MASSVVSGVAISVLQVATTPLAGDELVPVVQGGTTKQTTVADFVGTMAEAHVKGRAACAGTGPPQDLTQNQLTDLIVVGRNLVGRLNVPVLVAATRAITATDAGKGIVQAAAALVTLTIVPDATENLGDGFVTTIAVTNAAGEIDIDRGAGVTLINFSAADPNSDWAIVGIGLATLWRIQANVWGIMGAGLV